MGGLASKSIVLQFLTGIHSTDLVSKLPVYMCVCVTFSECKVAERRWWTSDIGGQGMFRVYLVELDLCLPGTYISAFNHAFMRMLGR